MEEFVKFFKPELKYIFKTNKFRPVIAFIVFR